MDAARKETPHARRRPMPTAPKGRDWKSPATLELLEYPGPLALLDPLEHLEALDRGCGWSGKDMAIQTT